ncbi:unnamed protein product [Acidithrix sp. C25]|nr:unnamed protein product [Acidithrix sp. C25]
MELDKWHYPLVHNDKLRDVHLESAKRAVQLCPELAIKIVDN